jgi:hypothetical protein
MFDMGTPDLYLVPSDSTVVPTLEIPTILRSIYFSLEKSAILIWSMDR